MPATVASVVTRVRERLRDFDARRLAFDIIEYGSEVAETYLSIQARIPPARLYTPNAFTIAAGETFTLPNSAGEEYAGDVRLQLISNGLPLTKWTREEIDAARAGVAQTPSIPTHFAIWVEGDEDVQGLVWPAARTAEPVNFYRTLVAADVRAAADMDAALIQFGRGGIEALVLKTAVKLGSRMTQDDLAARRINPAVFNTWALEAETGIYKEECRRHDLESVGRVMRWVS